jgi:hypothetical protein
MLLGFSQAPLLACLRHLGLASANREEHLGDVGYNPMGVVLHSARLAEQSVQFIARHQEIQSSGDTAVRPDRCQAMQLSDDTASNSSAARQHFMSMLVNDLFAVVVKWRGTDLRARVKQRTKLSWYCCSTWRQRSPRNMHLSYPFLAWERGPTAGLD